MARMESMQRSNSSALFRVRIMMETRGLPGVSYRILKDPKVGPSRTSAWLSCLLRYSWSARRPESTAYRLLRMLAEVDWPVSLQ